MRSTMLTFALVALATPTLAQERATAGQQEPRREQTNVSAGEAPTSTDADAAPRRALKVLQNPYDLSSYYRAGGTAPDGWAGLTNDPSYGIASFYRQQGGQPSRYGWSAFWTSGYSAPRPAPFLGYRRTIGENGDLFLMVPYLAPVGPITGAFFGY